MLLDFYLFYFCCNTLCFRNKSNKPSEIIFEIVFVTVTLNYREVIVSLTSFIFLTSRGNLYFLHSHQEIEVHLWLILSARFSPVFVKRAASHTRKQIAFPHETRVDSAADSRPIYCLGDIYLRHIPGPHCDISHSSGLLRVLTRSLGACNGSYPTHVSEFSWGEIMEQDGARQRPVVPPLTWEEGKPCSRAETQPMPQSVIPWAAFKSTANFLYYY